MRLYYFRKPWQWYIADSMVTLKFLIETISTSKNWFSLVIWTFLCEISKKLNWNIHNWSNHYFFEFSGSILLWFAKASSSESDFMESSDFLVIDLCSRLSFSKKIIRTFILREIIIIPSVFFVRCNCGFLNYLGAKQSVWNFLDLTA